MIVSLLFVITSIITAACFTDIDTPKENKNKKLFERITDYKDELKTVFGFAFKSKRLRAIMLFTLFFDGLVLSSYTLRESVLLELELKPQYFAIIISSLSIVAGIFSSLQGKIHEKFKNRVLTFIASAYVPTFVIAGIISQMNISWNIKIVSIVLLYVVQYAMQSIYYIVSTKYIKNFTSVEIRTKISSAFESIKSLSQVLIALISSYLLAKTTASESFVIIGVGAIILISFVLVYMKTRVGLKPEEYKEEDIKFADDYDSKNNVHKM